MQRDRTSNFRADPRRGSQKCSFQIAGAGGKTHANADLHSAAKHADDAGRQAVAAKESAEDIPGPMELPKSIRPISVARSCYQLLGFEIDSNTQT